MHSAGGNPLNVMGKCNITVYIEGAGFPTKAYVIEPLAATLILGEPFLKTSQAKIDCNNGWITFADEMTGTKLQVSQDKFILRASQSVIIPPLSEAALPVKIPKRCVWDEFMVQPLPSIHKRRLWMARIVVRPKSRFTFCRLWNPNDVAISIPQGAPLAEAVEIGELFEPDYSSKIAAVRSGQHNAVTTEMKIAKITEKGIPLDTKDLTKQQRLALINVLYDNIDLFATCYADFAVEDVPP